MSILAGGQLSATAAQLYKGTPLDNGVDLTLFNTSSSNTETIAVTATGLVDGTARQLGQVVLPPKCRYRFNVSMGAGDILKASSTHGTTVDFTVSRATGSRDGGYDQNGNILQVNGTTVSGPTTLTTTSASGLAVGRQGATNPVLQVDASTSSVTTGFSVKGAAGTGGAAIAVISDQTNESGTIDAKGTGTIKVNGTAGGGTGAVQIGGAASGANATGMTFTPNSAASGFAVAVVSTGNNENVTIDAKGSGTLSLQSVATGNVILGDAINLQVGTSTGTKIGSATTQKLALWNATPIVQPANTVDYVTGLVNVGLRASGGTAAATFPGRLTGQILNAGPAPTDTYSASMSIDVTKGYHVVLASNTTSATVTYTPSAAGTAGDLLTILTETDGTGTVTATFASTFHSSGTQATTLSKFSSITFQSDGTRWVELCRTTALT